MMQKNMLRMCFAMLVVALQATIGHCYYSIEEAYSSEVTFNKPGVSYDLSVLANAENVVWHEEGMIGIPDGFYLYKSHAYGDIAVLVFETSIYGTEEKSLAVRLVPKLEKKLTNMSGLGMANPAAVYCIESGGLTGYADTLEGMKGFCTVGNTTCEEWSYFYSNGSGCVLPLGNETVVNTEIPQTIEVEEFVPTIELTDVVMREVMEEELAFLTQVNVVTGLGNDDITTIRENVQVGLTGNNGQVIYEGGNWISSLESEALAGMPRLLTLETTKGVTEGIEALAGLDIPAGDVVITKVTMGAPLDASNPLLQMAVLAGAVAVSFALVAGVKKFKH